MQKWMAYCNDWQYKLIERLQTQHGIGGRGTHTVIGFSPGWLPIWSLDHFVSFSAIPWHCRVQATHDISHFRMTQNHRKE